MPLENSTLITQASLKSQSAKDLSQLAKEKGISYQEALNQVNVEDFISGIYFCFKNKKNRNLVRKSILNKFSYNNISSKYIEIYKKKINEKN